MVAHRLAITITLLVVTSAAAESQLVSRIKVSADMTMAVALAPNGESVACGDSSGIVSLWDIKSQQRINVAKPVKGEVSSVSFSPDGSRLVAGYQVLSEDRQPISGSIRVWDTKTFEELFAYDDPKRGFTAVSFWSRPDSIITCGHGGSKVKNSGFVRSWNLNNSKMQELAQLGTDHFTSLAVGAGNEALYLGSLQGGRRFLIDPKSRRFQLQAVKYPGIRVFGTAISPNGKKFAFSGLRDGFDDQPGMAVVDSVASRNASQAIPITVRVESAFFSVAVSPDGNHLALGRITAGDQITIWSLRDNEEYDSFSDQSASGVVSLAYSKDGKRLASAHLDGTVAIWNMDVQLDEFWRKPSAEWNGKELWQASRSGNAVSLTDRRNDTGRPVTIDSLKDVREASISASRLNDKIMPFIGSLSELEALTLRMSYSCERADEIEKLKKLRKLTLSGSAWRSQHLSHLPKCPELRELTIHDLTTDIEGTRQALITETETQHIRQLRELESLTLPFAPVTSRALTDLQQLPKLQHLDIDDTAIDANNVLILAKMSQLEFLYVGTVNDDALPVIATLASLKELILSDSEATDTGLMELAKLTNLEKLDLRSGTWFPCEELTYVRELPQMSSEELDVYALVRLLIDVKYDEPMREFARQRAEATGALARGSNSYRRSGQRTAILSLMSKLDAGAVELPQFRDTIARSTMELARKTLANRPERLTVVKEAIEKATGLSFGDVSDQKQSGDPTATDQKTFENSIGMKFIEIPAGSFVMGYPENHNASDARRHPNQSGSVTVEITRPYSIGVHEVTMAAFSTVLGLDAKSRGTLIPSASDPPLRSNDPKAPVHLVSWIAAARFCMALSDLPSEREAQRVYRLPTEAEWEYACRAGTTTMFSFGQDGDLKGNEANWSLHEPSAAQPLTGPLPVGSFAPNAFGLYDMHGNVAEWCVDNGDALWVEAVKDPVRLNNVKGPRIFRGGSFLSTAAQSTSYHRDAKIHDQPSTDNGFRVVCVVGPPDQLTKDILKHMAEAADPNTSKALGIRNEIARLTKSYNESGSMYDLLHRSEKYIDLADVCDTPTETLQLALIDVKLGLNRRSTFDEATQKSGYLWFRTEAEIRRKLADHFARLGRGDDAKREVEAALLATENALSDFTRYDRADLGPSVDAFGNKRPDASYRNYVQLYQQRAELYCQLNDYSNAIKELTKAIEYDTTSSRRYLERGQAYLKVNDYRKAAEDFNASLDLVDKGTNPAARSADILEEQKAILQLQRETYKKMGDDAKVVVIDESLARVEQQLADTKR